MTNKDISKIIAKLNRNNKGDTIFLRPLTHSVYYGKVWLKAPKPQDFIVRPDGPQTFYFIKQNEKFVGAVLDMNNDLHWYLSSSVRGRGILTTSMKEVILPHIFLLREKQRITIDSNEISKKNFQASEKVALTLGFLLTSKKEGFCEYSIKIEDFFSEFHQVKGENTSLSRERIDYLKRKINYISNYLWVIQTELDLAFGDSEYSNDIMLLVNEMKKQIHKMEDKWFDANNDTVQKA